MEFVLTKAAAAMLLPPFSLLILAAAGLVLLRFRRRAGLLLTALATGGLWLLCTPIVGSMLLGSIEPDRNPALNELKTAQAIVVLGGGSHPEAPEYGGDAVSMLTLERLRLAVRLHRETGVPILVSGGRPQNTMTSEAAQMRSALDDFQVEARWLEARANTTWDNARYSRALLAPEGIGRIALVTHASHMRRARLMFEKAGFVVIDSPTGFTSSGQVTLFSFLPNAQGLQQSRAFFHELLGLGWYHARLALGGT